MANGMSSQPGAQGPVKSGRGRSDSGSSETSPSGGTYETSTCCSSRQGTVVIRATVEHIGVAGDTEMTVTVKWPASTFCVQPIEPCAAPGGPGPRTPRVPANGPIGHNFDPGMLYGRLEQDIPPLDEGKDAQLKAEKETTTPSDESGYPPKK
jgi:hypothetical protein